MAVLVANQSIDMYDLLYYGSLAELFSSATIVQKTGTTFSVHDALTGEDLVLTGTFSYAGGSNYPTSGTITGVTYKVDGSPVFTLTAASISVADFTAYVNADDMGGLFQQVLAGNDLITGGPDSDYLFGFAGNDVINGGDGNDFASYVRAPNGVHVSLALSGSQVTGEGSDTLVNIEGIIGSLFGDVLIGNEDGNNLHAMAGNDNVYGAGGNDYLHGYEGDDYIDGGTGDDIMGGGEGNDTFIVDSAGDRATEYYGQGIDTVISSVSFYDFYSTTSELENLTLTGSDDIIGWGSNDANQLIGNIGANTLKGYGGNDTLDGGLGDDTLDGGYGDDTLNGGNGFDIASYADAAAGVTVSLAITSAQNTGDAGIDTLLSISGLEGSIYNDVLTGDQYSNLLLGGYGQDWLIGGEGNDTLDGGWDNDTLMGGVGLDRMYGGASDDTYIVDNAGDLIYELAGEGTDTVEASVTHYLRGEIEKLVLTGSSSINGKGNELANELTGNDGANRLSGLAGDDTLNGNGGRDILDGGSGNDTLVGGADNDIYVVDSSSDVIVENLGEGVDFVYASASFILSANVERMYLTGTGDIDGTGNELANLLVGNDGANALSGMAGNDRIYADNGNDLLNGGEGNDYLEGGAGRDDFLGGTGKDYFVFRDGDFGGATTDTADRILDFATGDRISLGPVDADTTLAGNQAFAFVGDAAFTNVAGQLRTEQIDGNTYLSGDTNGDGIADFMIRLDGLHTLAGSDFML